jgi:predicted glycogen debranching enzyme
VPLTPPITFGPQICGSLCDAGGAQREWLVTDGTGGYATGTVSGLRTRRYHALLVVADPVTAVRHVALAALDATLTLPSGTRIPLFTHEWASGAVAPQGHRHLESFTLADGLPRWRWRVGDVVVERELAMVHGRPALAVVHRVVAAPAPVRLSVAAMCTWRDAHGGRHASGPAPHTEPVADGVVVEGAYRLAGPGWEPAGEWHLGTYAREEAARGFDAVEDLWHAGSFTAALDVGQTLEVSAWAGDLADRPAPPTTVVAAARERAHRVVAAAKPVDGVAATLALAADAFVVETPHGPDVVAGYPWFGSYLGDTMTAYEGLFLRTGRADEGRALLVARVTGDMVGAGPGAAPAAGDPAGGADRPWGPHDSADALLWLAHAVERHVTLTGDTDLAAALVDPLDDLLRRHVDGTGALSVDRHDGLLRLRAVPGPDGVAPDPGSWMNAFTDDGPVTPRVGKPVEINALWVNALGALADLLGEAGRDATGPRERHRAAAAAFTRRFRADEGWLYDVVDAPSAPYPLGGGARHDDPTLRPNQLFAYSLPHAPLAGGDPAPVRAVGAALLTPLGLRTLAPAEYGYQGRHRGGRTERDIAYHQGTVWPWLIGPYVDACVAAGLPTDGLLTGLEFHVGEWGVGSLSETADGDPPHRATGCPFSARSVAEFARAWRRAA